MVRYERAVAACVVSRAVRAVARTGSTVSCLRLALEASVLSCLLAEPKGSGGANLEPLAQSRWSLRVVRGLSTYLQRAARYRSG